MVSNGLNIGDKVIVNPSSSLLQNSSDVLQLYIHIKIYYIERNNNCS